MVDAATIAKIVIGSAGLSVVLLVVYAVVSLLRVVRGLLPRLPYNNAPRTVPAAVLAAQKPQVHPPHKDRGKDLKHLIQESTQASKKKGVSKDEQAATHELFLNTLKGHADVVHGIAWSASGMFIATACEDMYVRIFDLTETVAAKEPKFKRVKTAKIPLGVGFGDSNDSVVTLMKGIPDAVLALYGPAGGAGGETGGSPFEEKWQVQSVHGRELPMSLRSVSSGASAGRTGLAVSISTKKDVRIFNLSGHEVAILEPNSLANHDLAVSADGRFVAVASFTAEVKIWEIKFGREGGFSGTSKAMELKGHKSQVSAVALSPDNKRAVTASTDGTLRVWNIDVRYGMSEDPKTLLVVPMQLPQGKAYQRLAIIPGSRLVAASYESKVHLISLASGELLESIDAHESTITCMAWCPLLRKSPTGGPVAVLATGSRDKRVRLWGWKLDV